MTETKKQRYPSIDGLRGIFIIIMASGHFVILQPAIEPPSYRWISFADPSQGFVFMSGIVLGLVLTRKLIKYGMNDVKKYTWSRVLLIYKYHIAALAFSMIVSSLTPNFPLGDTSGNSPVANFIFGSFLLHQPHYLDILPMYLILVAFTPIILHRIFIGKYFLVISVSFFLWVIAPIGFFQILSRAVGNFANSLGMGGRYVFQFDPFAWQIIYVGGLFFGYLIAVNKFNFSFFRGEAAKHLMLGSILLIFSMVIYKNINIIPGGFFTWIEQKIVDPQSKSLLTLFILLSFTSFAYAVTWFYLGAKFSSSHIICAIGAGLSFITSREVFVVLGRNSIQAFSAHLFWIYGSLAFATFFDLNSWERLFLFLLGFPVIYIVVILKEKINLRRSVSKNLLRNTIN